MVTSTPSASSQFEALRGRWRGRRSRRGAALFIVVLVILSLTGVALFAARSASVDVAIAGRYKQAAQTHQVARLGMQTTVAELGRDPSTYMRAMKDKNLFGGTPKICKYEVTKDMANVFMDTGGCYRFAYGGVESAIQKSAFATTPNVQLMQPGDWSSEMPSSIGTADTRPNFAMEMTDKVELSWPVPGFQGGQGTNMRFYTVTITGTGEIVPRAANQPSNQWGDLTITPTKAYMASLQETRAQVVVGPLPQGI
jgi:hypothetical protein